jgi:hypothetical protein
MSELKFSESHDGVTVEQAEAWATTFRLTPEALARVDVLREAARRLPVKAAREARLQQLDEYVQDANAMAEFALSVGGMSRQQVNGLFAGASRSELDLRVRENNPKAAAALSGQMYQLRMFVKGLIESAGEAEEESSAL